MGPQIGLLEFEDVELSISWREEPMMRSDVTVIGDEKEVAVFSKDGESMTSQDFLLFDSPKRFLVVTGNDALYPELYHYAASKGASFVIAYEKVTGMGGLLTSKYRGWVHSQESGLVVFEIIDVAGRLHYGIYAPLEKTDKNNGVLSEGNSPLVLEVDL